MTIAFKGRRHTIVNGLSGVLKMLVLLVGVPLALFRLWILTPIDASVLRIETFESLRVWARLFLLAIVILWLVATIQLLREIFLVVFHKQERSGATWSIRWATQIAGLLLLASTTSVLVGHSSSSTSAPARHLHVNRYSLEQSVSTSAHPVLAIDDCFASSVEPQFAANDQPFLDVDVIKPVTGHRREPGRHLDSPYIQWCFGDENDGDVHLDVTQATGDHHSLSDLWVALELSGVGSLIVASLGRRLRVLRKLKASARMPLEHIDVMPPRIAQTDAFLRSFCESAALEWLEIANRLLWKVLRERHRSVVVPDIRLVRCGPEGVEFLLSAPLDQAPLPFVSITSGYWWKLPTTSSSREWQSETANYGRYLPNLVPVGEDNSATYLVPVGPTRCLGVLGDNHSVDATLRAIVLGLRTLPWADELEIELFGPRVPAPAERAYHLHGSNTTILNELSRTARHLPKERLSTDWSREPLVVLGRGALSSSSEITLADLSRSVGVIAAGVSGTETLVIEHGHGVLSPYGIELNVPMLDEETGNLADTLLVHAGSPLLRNRAPFESPNSSDSAQESPTKPGTTELRLLCERPYLEHIVVDHPEPLASRVTELVTYLVLNDRSATVDELGTAMFPLSTMTSRAQIIRLCSAARQALGHTNEGQRLLSVSHDDVVRLDRSVTSDWHRFKRAAQLAPTLEPLQAVNLLEGVLSLVEGEPFSRVRTGFAWFVASGTVEEMQEIIVDATHHFAALSLALGQVQRAAWAIDQARLVNSSSEILVRDAMAICDARGDIIGIKAAYSRLERELVTLNAEPSLETTELFQSLRTNMAKAQVAGPLGKHRGSTALPGS